MGKRLGAQTIKLDNPPVIAAEAAVVGKKEGQGPLGQRFDNVSDDS